ncbi:MAG: Zinc metalloprotease (elastase), partial [Flavipsychrobacter sp.]|nr:Zinc metalloprotease (elastase) [Flavipsychrobacter sp.]
MKKNFTITRFPHQRASFKAILLAIAISAGLPSYAQDRKPEQPKPGEHHGKAAAAVIPGANYVRVAAGTPYPAFTRMDPSTNIKASDFVAWLKENVKASPATDFKLQKQDKDEAGIDHYRYVQTYHGIPIDKSTYIVHVKNGRVTSFNGFAVQPPSTLSATPALSETEGLEKAKQFIGAKRYKWEDDFWTKDLKERKNDPNATYYPKADLKWFVNKNKEYYRLAYVYDIHAADPDKIVRVYVDAQTGAVLQTLPLESNCSASSVNTIFNGTRPINTDNYSGSTFRLRDDCQGAIFHIRDWGGDVANASTEIENTTNTWTTMNERFGATVLWETERCYRYFLNVHGRNSYDNAAGDVNGYINAIFGCAPPPPGCTTANNASMSFDGQTMKVGLSSAGTLANSYATVDIIAHEFTHAVTGYSSNLEYQDEPGALNESFSDIFGEVIEDWVFSGHDWLLGDERTNGFIRSMSDPSDGGQPETYLTDPNWYTGTDDNGGVHTNSGVQNFWFYLLTVGGSGTNANSDAYNVSGIGLGDARAIAYRNNNVYLSQFSQYQDARDGAIQAAIDLFGECSNQVRQTTNAWYAVGVGEAFFDATAVVTSNYNGREVSCFNACDGAVTVNLTNATSPTFSWNNGPSTQSQSSLCPGVYTVTVTNGDAAACSVVKQVTIDNTPDVTVSAEITSDYNGFDVSCNGGNDGTATATGGGGTPPYSYSWSNGQNTANATGLSATMYKVVVTDANGCKDSTTVTLNEPTPLTIDAGGNQTVYWGYP